MSQIPITNMAATSTYPTENNITPEHQVSENVTLTSTTSSLNTTQDITIITTAGLEFGLLRNYDLFWAALYINKYYLWPILAIGIPGNLAALITISTMKPLTSSCVFVALLAVADSGALFMKILFHQLTKNNYEMGAIGCRAIYFVGSTVTMFANWVLVAMTIERFIAIWFPFRVNRFCTKRNTLISALVCFVLLAGLNMHFLWSMKYAVSATGKECRADDKFKDFMLNIWYWLDGVFYMLLPCVFVIVLNTLIAVRMKKSQEIQRALTIDKSNQVIEKIKQQQQLTRMLIVISVVFVFLTLPNAVFFAVKSKWNYDPQTYSHAEFIFVSQIIHVLADTNHAVNFFLYFCSGKKFRNKFYSVFCCHRKITRKSLYTSTYATGLSHSRSTNISTVSPANSMHKL